jgi:UPF0716 protein FxsA
MLKAPPWKYRRRPGGRIEGGADGELDTGVRPGERRKKDSVGSSRAMVDESTGEGKHDDRQGVRTVDMVGLLALLFIVVPIVELAVIIKVGQAIGVLTTIVVLLAVSVGGAWLVKREGIGVWRRFRQQVESGIVPGRELADGVMILLAGALLLTPGFVTDFFGLLLLLPPVRAAVRAASLRRVSHRMRRF